MPRGKNKSSGPSAAGRFLRSQSGAEDGKLIQLGDVAEVHDVAELVQDCVDTGGSITINRTLDGRSIHVQFYVDGEKNPWYLSNRSQWDEMVQTISD